MCSPWNALMGDENSKFTWRVSICSSLRGCVFRTCFWRQTSLYYPGRWQPWMYLSNMAKNEKPQAHRQVTVGDKLRCVSYPAMAVCTEVVECLQGKTCNSVNLVLPQTKSMYTVTAHQLIGGHFFSTFILPGLVVFRWLIWQALCMHSLWMAGS